MCVHVREVFVQPLNEFVSLWRTFGGGTKLTVDLGVVQPRLSVLPPSRVELEQGSATLLCLASGGFPLRLDAWLEGWRAAADSLGVLGKDGHYGWSSTLTLPADQWRKAGSVSCEASKSGQNACRSNPESWPVFRVERLQHGRFQLPLVLNVYWWQPGPYTEALEAQGTGHTGVYHLGFPQRALVERFSWAPLRAIGKHLRRRKVEQLQGRLQYGVTDRTGVPLLDGPFPGQTGQVD
ncbi:Immunoglobulin kappa light chain [Merluccius polli]|nr:Immunoglobulin kappa light chain [Merluccius polli]